MRHDDSTQETTLTLIGQVTGRKPPFILGTTFELGPLGYIEAEYSLSGTADAYQRDGDGVKVAERAEFSTRLLVRRPADAAAFNGTVWVEWLNVSGGADTAAAWLAAHTELIRSGAAWVGVSAQQIGVSGGTGLMGFASPGLVGLDPERYGELHHPGDRFSYDIFSQAGDAVRRRAGTIVADLAVERVLAVGESQSGFRLSTYLNDLDAADAVYDGFLVLARGGSVAPLDDEGTGSPRDGDPVPFRDDLRVPVLCVEAETDLITLGYQRARQEDADQLVTWEMAGTSHADVYTLAAGAADTGRLPAAELAPRWRPGTDLVAGQVDKPVNAGAKHYVVNAAFSWLDRWTRHGTRPPAASRLQIQNGQFVTDGAGNVLGGVRTPQVDVPVAALSGLGNSGGPVAFLCGTTTPLDTDALRARYPTPAAYLEQFNAATALAVANGFVLEADAAEITAIAAINSPSW
jgi:Alpha/beta hydrolase domain